MEKNKLFEFGSKTEKPIVIAKAPDDELWLDEKKDKNRFTQWAIIDQGKYRAQNATYNTLPPGFYSVDYDGHSNRPVFSHIDIKIDDLVRIPNSLADDVLKEIEKFWESEASFKKYGFLHYRGYLFYGSHGSGKTSLVQMIAKSIIDDGGLIFVCKNPEYFIEGLQEFRTIEPTRPVIGLFEDIDAIIKKYGEDKILSFLDGEHKVDKILNIATTNYPEILDKRIVSRPRRFDRVIRIGYPDAASREAYLKTKLEKSEVKHWVKETGELSFASLAELVVSVKCLNKGFEETLQLLKDMQLRNVSSDDDKGSIGFGETKDDDL